MNGGTRYRALRVVGRLHTVLGTVVLGLTIVGSGGMVLVALSGVTLLGVTGDAFYRGPQGLIGAGIASALVGALIAAFLLGVGQLFRAVADLADNSAEVLFEIAALPGYPLPTPKADAADRPQATAGPIAF